MKIGESRYVNMLLRFLGNEIKNNIEDFVNEVSSFNFQVMQSKEEIYYYFEKSITEFLENINEEELLDLRSYTGYQYKNINAILSGIWSYEENGLLTDEIRKKYLNLSESICQIVNKFPNPNICFVTYRGTQLSEFSKYGIASLEQLNNMKGKYMYEERFSSTSILENTCYFNKKIEGRGICNIEIQYLISNECNEGILLLDNSGMSYSLNQNEYLINKGTLSKVVDVNVDKDKKQAILKVVVIPKEKWNVMEVEVNKTSSRKR